MVRPEEKRTRERKGEEELRGKDERGRVATRGGEKG